MVYDGVYLQFVDFCEIKCVCIFFVVLWEHDGIIERWKGYYGKLLNADNPRTVYIHIHRTRSTLADDEELDAEVTHIVLMIDRVEEREESVWIVVRLENYESIKGELWGRHNRTVVRPALVYGACALEKAQENKLEVAEMRMLR